MISRCISTEMKPQAFDCFCPYSDSKPVLSPKCETEQLVPCFHFLSRNLRGKITLTRTSLCRCYYCIKFSSLSNSNHVERRSVECHLIVQERFTAVCLLRRSLRSMSAKDSFVKQSFWPPWVKQDNVTNTCGLLNVWWMFLMLQPDNCSNKSTDRVLISASSAHFFEIYLNNWKYDHVNKMKNKSLKLNKSSIAIKHSVSSV